MVFGLALRAKQRSLVEPCHLGQLFVAEVRKIEGGIALRGHPEPRLEETQHLGEVLQSAEPITCRHLAGHRKRNGAEPLDHLIRGYFQTLALLGF